MGKKYEEKLMEVNFEQAKNLKVLGFDWNCGNAYNEHGKEVNWTTKQFNCWKPTVALALKFMRDKYGIALTVSSRNWGEKGEDDVRYSVWHCLKFIGSVGTDLSEFAKHKDNDGILSDDYDEAESMGLDMAIGHALENISRDFSWLKPGVKAFKTWNNERVLIEEVNHEKKLAKFNGLWAYFRIFNKEPKL